MVGHPAKRLDVARTFDTQTSATRTVRLFFSAFDLLHDFQHLDCVYVLDQRRERLTRLLLHLEQPLRDFLTRRIAISVFGYHIQQGREDAMR